MTNEEILAKLGEINEGMTDRKDKPTEVRSDYATHTLRHLKRIKEAVKGTILEADETVMKTFRVTWDRLFIVLMDQNPADFDKWWLKP